MSDMKRFVVLPAFGFESNVLAASAKLRSVGSTVSLVARRGAAGGSAAKKMRVLHSTHEDGPKLVEMTDDAELNLRAEIPGIKVVPLTFYRKMRVEHHVRQRVARSAGASLSVTIRVKDRKTARAVGGAKIVAFTDYQRSEGAEAKSDRSGAAKLKLKPGTTVERLFVYGPMGYWGHYARGIKLKDGAEIGLLPIDLQADASLLARFGAGLPLDGGSSVRVAVVDSGVAQSHPGLPNATGGLNLVLDETQGKPGAEAEWGPAKTDGDHGTHVAGIIGGRPHGTVAIRGVAPGV